MSTTAGYSDVEYVFEPHVAALPDLRQYFAALDERRPFMVELARSDLRSLRSRTSLGRVWSVLDPLFQGALYFFLYAVIRGGGGGAMAFLPVLIPGIFLFGLSTGAFGEAGASIRRAKGLMLNSTFPRALLPLTAIYKGLRQFVPSACVLVVLFPLVGGQFGPGFFVLPLLFGVQAVMNVGIALLVSTFIVLVADAANVINWVTRVLFFATPVIYPVTLLPDGIRQLLSLQPLFPLFSSYQAVFSGRMPNPREVALALAWAVALVVIGGRLFLRHEREFALHL